MFNATNLEQALAGIGLQGDQKLFRQLATAYSEDVRYYHNDVHIGNCLTQLQACGNLADRPAEIQLALWFHDAIYDPRQPDNEERSAAWASDYLTRADADQETIARIVNMILGTKHHAPSTVDERLMVDIDLSILGASPVAFEEYDRAIRQEYHWVPAAQYRDARAHVLASFLNRKSIYQTPGFYSQYEDRARANLTRKIAELSD